MLAPSISKADEREEIVRVNGVSVSGQSKKIQLQIVPTLLIQ
jgi:hypothetical protein